MKILVTGASGFIGRSLMDKLHGLEGFEAVGARRRANPDPNSTVHWLITGDLAGGADWSIALQGVDVVIHLAALAHRIDRGNFDAESVFFDINTNGTIGLAKQAAAVGVKRFIFVSSIGVNGNTSTLPFSAGDLPKPVEPYARSKWKAEQGLHEVQQETGMETVIIRPPLVYGPGAPGNFGSLLRWVASGVPIPLGAINNKRSLVGIDNLVDLIIRCLNHPAAANQVFLAGDGEDLSTTELLRGVAEAMGRPARLVPVPACVLRLGASLLGKRAVADRLLGSLQVDISKARDLLDWTPPVPVKEGLRRCIRDSSV